MCTKPIDLKTMEIDHIIPESLILDRPKLEETLTAFGLSLDFSLNSYENWLPACRSCNGKKGANVFAPTPLVQLQLTKASRRAAQARSLAKRTVKQAEITKALNILEKADESGELSDEVKLHLRAIGNLQEQEREPSRKNEPILLAPNFSIPAHEHSSYHRDELLKSETCGCFFCLRIFNSSEIVCWTDKLPNSEKGETALCPYCGIDSVIGSQSGYPMTHEFLEKMNDRWFGGIRDST
ncbi:HNH endonuclease [Blastopirellula retiformator]|nr:HNH endonuclease [Blastopirellula retiformator]